MSCAAAKSIASMALAPRRVAESAASFTRLARSAPEKPGVFCAMSLRSTSWPIGLPLACTSRMESRAAHSGRSTTTRRSNRPGRKKCGVEHIRTVRRRDHDGEIVAAEAIHLRKELVQRLLAFVVAAAEARAPRATDGVDFVDENDRRRDFLRLGEELAHPGGAHADEQLDELRAAHRKERNAGLPRHGAGQECLSRTRRADEQDAPRDLAAEALEPGGLAQKIDDLPQVLLGGLEAGNVVELNADRALLLEAMRALPQQSSQGPAARQHFLCIAREDEPHADDRHPRQHARSASARRRAVLRSPP